MAALSGTALLAACGEGETMPAANAAQAPAKAGKPADAQEVQVFENVFECAKKTDNTRAECAEMRKEALAVASKEAPRYQAIQDCEQEYGEGRCVSEEEPTTRRRHFSPFLAAFIYHKSDRRPTPLFRGRDGAFKTPNGMRLGYAGQPGKYYAGSRAFEKAKTVPKVKPASKLAARGGFGERAGKWNLNDRNGSTGSRMSSRGG